MSLFAKIAYAFVLLSSVVSADQGAFDGMTPKGIEPGSPAGSYSLSNLDTVNLYNGSANLTIPLLQIGGRGEAGYTMVAAASSRWIEYGGTVDDPTCNVQPCPQVAWRNYYKGDWSGSSDLLYRPASIFVREGAFGSYPEVSLGAYMCPGLYYVGTLTRLTVKFPDFTEMELRDAATGGSPLGPGSQVTCFTTNWGDPGWPNRGKVWVAADGSATTFVADADVFDGIVNGLAGGYRTISGTLYMRDGRQFRFDSSVVSWIQDRNGNRTTFQSPGSQSPPCSSSATFCVTDPLGRTTEVTIGSTWNGGTGQCQGTYDQIKFKGSSGADRFIRVYRRNYLCDSDTPNPANWPTYYTLFAYATDLSTVVGDSIAMIELPDDPDSYPNGDPSNSGDGHLYRFHYTAYGEVSRMDLPSSGAYEFDWANGPGTGCCYPDIALQAQNPNANDPYYLVVSVYRRLIERREYANGGTGSSWTRRTVYQVTEQYQATNLGDPLQNLINYPQRCAAGYCSYAMATEFDPVLGNIGSQVHYFYGAGSHGLFPDLPTWYSPWMEAREFRTDFCSPGTSCQPTGGGAIRMQTDTWQQRASSSWWNPNPGSAFYYQQGPEPSVDSRIQFSNEFLDNGKMSQRQFGYSSDPNDNTNNQIDVWEMDYGDTSGSTGLLIHQTHTDFRTDYNSPLVTPPAFPVHLRNLPSQTVVYDGIGTVVAQTQYCYDTAASDTQCPGTPVAPAPAPGITNNVAVSLQRGNVTHLKHWRNSDGAWLDTRPEYNVAGNVIRTTNPRGYATNYSYFTCPTLPGTYSFVSSVTNAKNQIASYGYDCYLGKPTSITDPNNISTTGEYGIQGSSQDKLDRLDLLVRGNGLTQTHYAYPDLETVTVFQDRDSANDRILESATVTDGLGRNVESRLYTAPGSYISTKRDLDALGRSRTQYNPGSTTDGTSYTYDVLGREATIKYADGSSESFQWNGDLVVHTDPSPTSSQQQVDAFGRIRQVVEDYGGTNLTTTYTYDALDNLTGVNQSGRTRTFIYDSLSRLYQAANPESNTITYTYDPAGNLLTKTSPAPNQTGSATVTTNFQYDVLNRLTMKTYSDGTTPQAQYFYDNYYNEPGDYGMGRLSGTWDGANTGTNYRYDPMGRILIKQDCAQPICNNSWWTTYNYDLLGNITSYTVPNTTNPDSPPSSFVKFTQSFDAAARPTQLTSNLVDSQHPATLLTVDPNVGYYPSGTMRKVTLGNGLAETAAYNSRLQPCRMNVNSTGGYYSQCTDAAPSGNVLDFTYGFNAGANNGNITFWSAAGNQTFSRTYTYDSLNRIATMADSDSSQSCKGLSWTIDPWGNRTDQTVTAGACNTFHQAVDTSNRLLGAPFQYDAAGNMIHDASHSYTYDAENRLIQVDGGSTATYVYDPEGRRVAKAINGTTTDYVHDLAGNVLFEAQGSSWVTAYIYFAGALHAQYKNNTTYFLHRDHLGSTRLVTAIPTVDVRFTNDSCSACGGNPVGGGDRNLFVNSVTVGSMTVAPNDPSVSYLTPPCNSFSSGVGVLACNGDMLVATTPQASAQTITVNAYGSPDYSIYPHMQLLVNGTVVGQWDVTGSAQNYTVSVPIAPWAYDSMDYLPFGEQIAGDTGTTHKFTGKERDAETGLDFFEARYFAGAQGRFTSPDPLYIQKEMFADPQRWNLYAYARNNPLVYVDPTGKTVSLANCQDKQQCAQVLANAAQLPKGVSATADKSGNLKLEGDLSKIKGGNALRLLQLVQSDKTANFWIGDRAPAMGGGTLPVAGGLSGLRSQGFNQNFAVVQPDPSRVESGDLYGVFLNADGSVEHTGNISGTNIAETAAHELLGHVWADLIGGELAGTLGNQKEAVIAEDRVRNTDPSRGLKIRHQDSPQLIRVTDLPRITNPGSQP